MGKKLAAQLGNSKWISKVDTKISASGDSQMTTKWIKHDLRYILNEIIYKDILEKGYESILIGVSKKRPMILKSLDENARIIPTKITQTN